MYVLPQSIDPPGGEFQPAAIATVPVTIATVVVTIATVAVTKATVPDTIAPVPVTIATVSFHLVTVTKVIVTIATLTKESFSLATDTVIQGGCNHGNGSRIHSNRHPVTKDRRKKC